VHSVPIDNRRDLERLCDRVSQSPIVGFDTEFVSEHTYYPELCLVQVVTPDGTAVIDPKAVEVRPFWETLATGDRLTVFHAGREELNFMLRATGSLPQRFFDVQIAAGFCGNEYPAAYSSLVGRFLGKQIVKGEQRTDWRRRPLSEAQINYALEDVRYLLPLEERLRTLLNARGRLPWLDEEQALWQSEIVSAQSRSDWRRVSGIGALNAKSLGVVRELWFWRQKEAQRVNQPPKRLLRDDLMVEIARRKIDQPDQILAIRGLQRSDLKRNVRDLVECVRRGVESPPARSERGSQGEGPPQLNLLGQFLTPALTTICRRAEVAASMVGTATDVRDLIARHFGFGAGGEDELPALLRGWRAELVGNLLDELLSGAKSIRIANALHDDPLAFDDVGRE